MDCPSKQQGFGLILTTKLPSRSDLNRKYGIYQNFLKPDGSPKTFYRLGTKKKYALKHHLDKIKDKKIKEKFFKIRNYIKTLHPDIIERHSKRRITYRKPDGFNLYTLQLHRKNMWLGTKDKNGFSYLKIGGRTNIKTILKPFNFI